MLFEKFFYHPDFNGSFSIKSVLPALVPSLSYDGLEVRDGLTAAAYFERSLNGNCTELEKTAIRNNLLEYCKQDTLAMVEIYRVLLKKGRQLFLDGP